MAINGNEPVSVANLKAIIASMNAGLVGKDIGAYSWGELIDMAGDTETAPLLDYLVSQYRSIAVTGIGTFEFQLVAINHYDMAGGGKAAMTFQALPIMMEKPMNASSDTTGGWASCQLRTWCNGDFYNALPGYLREHVVETRTPYNVAKGGAVKYCVDKAFTPSEMEVFGTSTYDKSGARLRYYQLNDTNNGRIKKYGESGRWWWLRSVASSSDFAGVDSGGYLSSYTAGNYGGGVAPCFSIGKS